MLSPFPLAKSAAAKTARQLHDEAIAASELISQALATNADAEKAVQLAQETFDAEITRAAKTGLRSEIEPQLANALASARVQAAPEVAQRRIRSAQEAAAAAQAKFEQFCRDHAAELLAEVVDDADKAAEAVRKAEEKAQALLQGPLAARSAAAEKVAQVIALVGDAGHPWPLDLSGELVPNGVREVIARAEDPAGFDAARETEITAAKAKVEKLQESATEIVGQLHHLKSEIDHLTVQAWRNGTGVGQIAHWQNIEIPRLQSESAALGASLRSTGQELLEALEVLQSYGALSAQDVAQLQHGEHAAQRLAAGEVPPAPSGVSLGWAVA